MAAGHRAVGRGDRILRHGQVSFERACGRRQRWRKTLYVVPSPPTPRLPREAELEQRVLVTIDTGMADVIAVFNGWPTQRSRETSRSGVCGAPPEVPSRPSKTRSGDEHDKPKRSPAAKIAVILILILALSAATAFALRPGDAAYTQILLGGSDSEAGSATEIAACAERAIEKAIEREEIIDIAVVSGVPAAMGWRTIDARQSLGTRLTFRKAREQHKLAADEAMAALRELMRAETPPRSSDHFGALAESRARADGAARHAAAADRSTVVCSDGHWSSDCGSAYTAFENEAVLRCLRESGLAANWNGATIYFDASTVDEVAELPAPQEAAIRSLWGEWSRTTGANLEYL